MKPAEKLDFDRRYRGIIHASDPGFNYFRGGARADDIDAICAAAPDWMRQGELMAATGIGLARVKLGCLSGVAEHRLETRQHRVDSCHVVSQWRKSR